MIINKQIRLHKDVWEAMQNCRKDLMKQDRETTIIQFMTEALQDKIEKELKSLKEGKKEGIALE